MNTEFPASITVDGAGNGTLDGWVTISTPAAPWLNWINGDHHVSLPLSRGTDGTLGIRINEQFFRQAFPRPYYRAADYNQDGSIAGNDDYVAFMAAFLANAPLADRNGDGAWDQSDVDSWQELFNYENSIPR